MVNWPPSAEKGGGGVRSSSSSSSTNGDGGGNDAVFIRGGQEDGGGERTARWPLGTSGLAYDREWAVVDRFDRALRLKQVRTPCSESCFFGDSLLGKLHFFVHGV